MRSRFHIGGIVALLIVTLAVIFGGRIVSGKRDVIFSIDSDEEVRRVVITRGDKKVSLSLESGGWMVNERSVAREQAIDFLIRTLKGLEVKSTVSDELFRTVVTEQKIEPVEVRIYGKRKLVNGFMVYNSDSIPGGNIMLKGPGSKPYMVYLPGWDLNPGIHFVPDEKFWQPFLLFNLMVSDIKEVSLTYGKSVYPELEISVEDEGYSILLNGATPGSVDTASVKRYLSYFSYVPFEKWPPAMPESERRDIIESVPEFRIDVVLTSGESIKFFGWKRLITGISRSEYDTDRIWGSINEGRDIFIARYYDIDPLLKRADYFISH